MVGGLLGSLQLNRAYQMDCLEGMKLIPNKSIDMILCDLPYGTTKCSWDTAIPFEPLWEQYERIIKDNGAILLFGIEPFSSNLRISNLKMYRYDWVWHKDRHANFLFAKKQPLKKHENISVFYKKQPTYNPQMTEGKKNNSMFKKGSEGKTEHKELMNQNVKLKENKKDGLKYPSTIQFFQCISRGKNVHPTQKPVELFEYFIKTYTNENDIVMDSCLGSGTTAVACEMNNRKWIGFETEKEYIEIINKRLEQVESEKEDLE